MFICAWNIWSVNPAGSLRNQKQRKTCLDDSGNDLKKMGVTGLRKIAGDTGAWKMILQEARVLQGPQSQ